jgi:hypothetical protein
VVRGPWVMIAHVRKGRTCSRGADAVVFGGVRHVITRRVLRAATARTLDLHVTTHEPRAQPMGGRRVLSNQPGSVSPLLH